MIKTALESLIRVLTNYIKDETDAIKLQKYQDVLELLVKAHTRLTQS